MAARPIVIPVFVNGLGNDLGKAIWNNFKKPERRGPPIIVVFGKPIEFGSLLKGNPRASQYKRVADHVAGEIRKAQPARARASSGRAARLTTASG